MSKVKINANEIAKDITVEMQVNAYKDNVHIVGYNVWMLRLKLGLFIVKLGIWITGMNFQYDGEVHESD